MNEKIKQLVKAQDHVNSIDKLMILCYNLILVAGACYLIYYKDASAWLLLLVLVMAGSWKESKKDD